MGKIIRICYECNEPIETAEEAIEGQKLLDIINKLDPEYESPWVHCRGEKEEFVQEVDKEVLDALSEGENNYVGSIYLHPRCIVKTITNTLWP